MATRIDTEIIIAASPALVWQVLTDWQAYPQWNPFILSLDGQLACGQRLQVTIQPPGGNSMVFRPTVVSHQPGSHFAWLGRVGLPGLFDGRHAFTLQPMPDGTTRLLHGEQFSGLLTLLLSTSQQRQIQQGFITMNEALAARCKMLASTRPD